MRLRSWVIAFFTTVLYILVKGYYFNSGDQEEHLPQVYQLINPALYPHDYFLTAYHQTFTVRFYFVWLIYLFHFILPVSATCFLFHLICLTVSAWAIREIVVYFNVKDFFADVTPVFVFIFFNGFIVGGNSFIDPQLTCGSFAVTSGSLAFLFAIKRKWNLVAICAGLASIMQVLAGLQVMFIITIIFLFTEKTKHKAGIFLKMLGLYLLISAPMLLPIIYLQARNLSVEQSLMFYDILYRVRNPNHYLPSAFPLIDYVKFLSLTILAGCFVFFIDKKLKQIWLIVFTVVFGGMLMYTLLLESFHVLPIGKLQWFKTAAWMMIMNVIVVAAFTSKFFKQNILLEKLSKTSTFLILSFSFIGLIIICNSKYLPFKKLQSRYHVLNYPPSDLEKMHEWINTHTPVSSIILTSPSDDSFLCEAQRSMPIGWKAIIHEPFFLIPWYEKLTLVYHHGIPFTGFNVLQQAEQEYNKNPPLPLPSLKWDYRIADISKGRVLMDREQVIHRENNILLLKLKAE